MGVNRRIIAVAATQCTHGPTAFSTHPTRASAGYSGLNRASSPLSRVSRELPRGLLARCVPLNGGIRWGERRGIGMRQLSPLERRKR